jgi:hypothetical protein
MQELQWLGKNNIDTKYFSFSTFAAAADAVGDT